jgi:hypothetical protein
MFPGLFGRFRRLAGALQGPYGVLRILRRWWRWVLGVVNVADEATLNQMMVEYPFTPFSEITVCPILEGDTALTQWRQVMQQMMGGPS